MQIKKGVVSMVLAAILMMGAILTASQAQAVPLAQQWVVTNTSPFDHIELYMMGDAGNAFSPATTRVDGAPGWTTQR